MYIIKNSYSWCVCIAQRLCISRLFRSPFKYYYLYRKATERISIHIIHFKLRVRSNLQNLNGHILKFSIIPFFSSFYYLYTYIYMGKMYKREWMQDWCNDQMEYITYSDLILNQSTVASCSIYTRYKFEYLHHPNSQLWVDIQRKRRDRKRADEREIKTREKIVKKKNSFIKV